MSVRELGRIAAELDEGLVEPNERLDADSNALLLREILFHDERRYWQFTPTQTGHGAFPERLYAWLTNGALMEGDAATLLRLVPEVQFVDRDDMLTLYRAAFEGPIQRWLMDILDLSFALPEDELRSRIRAGVGATWFCPVTDSFDIGQFHHANGLAGKDQRPPWRILKKFADGNKVRTYMNRESLTHLVLMEDFVGSGVQAGGPLEYAAKLLRCPILFVPLIVTARGLERLLDLARRYSHIRVEPVFVLPAQVQVEETTTEGEYSLFTAVRDIVTRTFDVVRQPTPPETEALQEPFGFKGIGALLVLHTNCPNNTLPLVWHGAPEWRALFPRISRS